VTARTRVLVYIERTSDSLSADTDQTPFLGWDLWLAGGRRLIGR